MAFSAAAACWAAQAGAQPQGEPADPAARVPAASYRSPFAGYRPLGDEAVGNWRAANDEVGRIGGWREYLREAQAPEEPGKAPGSAPSRPAPGAGSLDSHRGHGMPGGKP